MLSLLCPPCPSSIVSKLAFSPPPPTYTFDEGEGQQDGDQPKYKFRFTLDENKVDWQFSPDDMKYVSVFYAYHGRRERSRLACMHVRRGSPKDTKYTILFSHGNAADIGLMASFYFSLSYKLNCNVVGYDYSGYGISSGKPSESNLYKDIKVVWEELKRRYNLEPRNVILYGQSIGTVPTTDLATKHDFAGVILHSSLTSGLRLAFPNTKRTWFFDAFPNIDKVPKIKSPTLVIHGTEDEVIDISHGHAIHSLCQNPVSPLWVEHAGHNDIELYKVYLERLRNFVQSDIKTTTTN